MGTRIVCKCIVTEIYYLDQLIILSVHMSVQFELCVWNMFAGKDVVILQNLLLRSPFVKPIDTTGIYDNNTAHAVASYQNGNHLPRYSNNPGRGGGGTRWILGWGGAAQPLIPWPRVRQKSLIFRPKTEFLFLIPCLRHLNRNHTLCKTIINIETYLIHWQSQN